MWTRSTAIPASAKRVSGNSHGDVSLMQQIARAATSTPRAHTLRARLGGDTDGAS